MFHLVSLSFA